MPEVLAQLKDQLSTHTRLFLNSEIPAEYFHDATEFNNQPAGVLIAQTADDIRSAVLFCASHSVPITTRGAGTGLSGGCVASNNGLVISTEKMARLEIDTESRVAIAEPGLITADLMKAAAEHDLCYPPDPASYQESTIGGNLAENAGGLSCLRFGVTRDYVLGLEAILADGSTLKTGWFADRQGLALTDLLVASEGTLAIVTKAALRLVSPYQHGATILAAFDRPDAAAQSVTDIRIAGMIPTVMEFMDGDAAACSNQYEATDGLDDVAAILLIETADTDPGQADKIAHICQQNSCSYIRRATTQSESDELWRVRRNLSKATKAASSYRLSEDVAVPNSQFPRLVEFVAEMNHQSRFRINSFGHAGDGNLHVNFMADSDDPETLAEIDRHVLSLMQRTIELGGTLTGEHGIGLAKRAFLGLEFDPSTQKAMRMVKEVFDPDFLLNPDKLFATSD